MSHRGKPVTRQIREQRQREAAVRQAEYDALSLQQKLDKLPAPPAAARQRAKLMGQTQKPKMTVTDSRGVTHGTGALPPEGWAGLVGKTVEEIDTHFAEKAAAEAEPKKVKAKERRAQEKK